MASALCFTEALSGYMAAAGDREAGYRAGRTAGARVRYRATARIDDIESFLRDPQHGAEMTGVVDVTGLGRGMPIEEGRIELFCRREDRKVIAYHLPFRQGERRYLLRGEKYIQDDPGFDVWKDMTTLYAELLDLSSAPDGPPIAVGYTAHRAACGAAHAVHLPGRRRAVDSKLRPPLPALLLPRAARHLRAPALVSPGSNGGLEPKGGGPPVASTALPSVQFAVPGPLLSPIGLRGAWLGDARSLARAIGGSGPSARGGLEAAARPASRIGRRRP